MLIPKASLSVIRYNGVLSLFDLDSLVAYRLLKFRSVIWLDWFSSHGHKQWSQLMSRTTDFSLSDLLYIEAKIVGDISLDARYIWQSAS